jgi:D-alanyl-lipoteichoic acid acyltransferase DltB (MBOAT superfamily)
MGLLKKVAIADPVAIHANAAFEASKVVRLTFSEAWFGALAYTLQLYFDFSGYSDMAVGLSLLFGVWLPFNFNSPYKATSIIDFWRRWHMTLSRFLRDYLYIPLGGNKLGPTRRYINIGITMALGGLWHGANWTFLLWGILHGAFLMMNHAFRNVASRLRIPTDTPYARAWGWAITFLCVIFAWVMFRADSTAQAFSIWASMVDIPSLFARRQFPHVAGGDFYRALLLVPLAIALFAPNTQTIMRLCRARLRMSDDEVEPDAPLAWRPSPFWAAVLTIGFLVCLMNLFNVSQFIYFNF